MSFSQCLRVLASAIVVGFVLAATTGGVIAQTGVTRLEPSVTEVRGERLLREPLLVKDMRSDGGVGYVARVRLGRGGDRESNSSRCRLLEDGVPLPHPRSLHKSIRDQGGGRYSHWTKTSVYFSASDSTDPRSNGRTYELVSDESFVRKTARLNSTGERTSFRIATPADAQVRPVSTTIRNLDQRLALIPRLARNGDPDLTSTATILSSITSDDMSAEKRAVAIWKFLVDWRYHDYPAEDRGEIHDPIKLINVYGYGFCDDSAAAFCQLASAAGMKTRSYGLSGHVVAEAFYENRWHMFDPDHEVFYRNNDGAIASVAELEANPQWITHEALDPIGSDTKMIADLYTTRGNNNAFQAASRSPLVNRMIVPPGGQVVFDFARKQRVHRRIFLDRPLPQAFANGTLSMTPPREIVEANTYYVRWPYVILGGAVTFAAADSPVSIMVSKDRAGFDPIDHQLADGETIASLDAWIDDQPEAVYQFWLRVQGVQSPLQMHLDFQFAPRAHAHIQPGENELELSVASADGTPLSDPKGIELEIRWDEVTRE